MRRPTAVAGNNIGLRRSRTSLACAIRAVLWLAEGQSCAEWAPSWPERPQRRDGEPSRSARFWQTWEANTNTSAAPIRSRPLLEPRPHMCLSSMWRQGRWTKPRIFSMWCSHRVTRRRKLAHSREEPFHFPSACGYPRAVPGSQKFAPQIFMRRF